MNENESRINALELPEWVKLVNELVKKNELKSAEYLPKARSNP